MTKRDDTPSEDARATVQSAASALALMTKETTPLAAARATVARLQHERELRERELSDARLAEEAAIARYDASQGEAEADGAAKARLARERVERLIAGTDAELTRARTMFDAEERADMIRLYELERGELASFLADLDLAPFRALDAALEEAVLSVATQIVRAQDLHANASEHASKIGRYDVPRRLSLADARLMVTRALATKRELEKRDDLSAWLQSGPISWKERDLNAAELEAQRAHHDATVRASEAVGVAAAFNAGKATGKGA